MHWMRVLVLPVAIVTLSISTAQAGTNELQPKRHFKIERPASLTNTEALTIYDNVADQMARGYADSGDPAARDYRQWQLFNTAPYRSATHGNRYVSNYANAKAADYAKTQNGLKLPAGAVVVKDSFTVTAEKQIFAGAFFVMEKLAAGTSPETADWRYVMIMPDGSYFGDTSGSNAQNVDFCHGCHKAVSENDYLYFVPEKFRRLSLAQ